MRSECYSTLFVSQCASVSDTILQASVVKGTRKFLHQRSVNDTLQCFDSWILLTMLGSRDMAKFVSQEAYDRASLHARDLSARDQSHALAVRVRTRALLSEQFAFFLLVSCLIYSSNP